jgi:hypothetical protein
MALSNPAKNWCFTLNNWTDAEKESIIVAAAAHSAYCIFQQEVGDAGGQPHLQGYISLRDKKRLTWLRERFSARAHYEVARGTPQQNKDYCSKDETRVPGSLIFEHGTVPAGQGNRSDLEAVAHELLVSRRRLVDIAHLFPSEFIKYHGGLRALSAVTALPRRWKTVVYWFHGPTGSGKTRAANELASGAYWKMGGNKWWDGYDGHADVIIDDYRCDLCPFHELLRLLDRFPMQVEYKGGTCQFSARRVFITSPLPPRAMWSTRCDEDLAQLERRLAHVVDFAAPNMFEYVTNLLPEEGEGEGGPEPDADPDLPDEMDLDPQDGDFEPFL